MTLPCTTLAMAHAYTDERVRHAGHQRLVRALVLKKRAEHAWRRAHRAMAAAGL